MSSRFNDFGDDEYDDEEELEDELDAKSGKSPNNPYSSGAGAAVRGAGLPSPSARPQSGPSGPSSGGGSYPSTGGQRPPASSGSPGSATAFSGPSGNPSRPNIPGSSAPSSGSSGVQPFQRPPLGGGSSGGASPGGQPQRPPDPRAPSSGGYGSPQSGTPISKPVDPRSQSPSSSGSGGSYGASSASTSRPGTSAPQARLDDRKPAKAQGGGIGSKLTGMFGRGDKGGAPSAGKPGSGRPADPKASRDSGKGGGLFGRFGRGGDKKDDKNARAGSSLPGSSSALSSSSSRGFGSTSSGSSSPMSSGSSASGQRSGTPYGGVSSSAAPGKAQPQSGRSAGKGGQPRRSLLSRLNFFGARGESRTARTARQGPAVELQPVSFARDKQLEILGLAMTVAGIVLLLSSLSPVQGSIPQQANTFLSSLLGWGAVAVPIAMVPLGMWLILIRVGQNAPVVALTRIVGLVLLFVGVLVLMQFIDALSYPPGQGQTYDQYLAALENVLLPLSADFGRGGGRFGGLLYFQLIRNFSEPGGFVILLGVLAVGLMLTLSVSAYEIAAIIIGSFRNLRDAFRRRRTRIAAEQLAAQTAVPVVAAGPALSAPAASKAAALPATTLSGPATQPLPLEAPAQERSIPILMGGRPLTPGDADLESTGNTPAPFPALTPAPKPGEHASVTPVTAATEEPARSGSMFGRLKGALPAVGAATVLAAKSTVSAMTPDKERPAATAQDDAAKKGGPLGKLFSRASSTAPAAEAPPSAPTTGGSPTAPTGSTQASTAASKPPLSRAPLPAPPHAEPDDVDDVDVFDDDYDELEDDETGAPPARLGDLLRPPVETSKPAPATASAAPTGPQVAPPPLTRPGAPASSGVTPFSRPPLGSSARQTDSPAATSSTPSATSSTASAGPASPAAAAPAAASVTSAPSSAASDKPAGAAAVRPPEGLRKPALPLDDDEDWSHLPPARPKGAIDHGKTASPSATPDKPAAPVQPAPPPSLQSRLETLRSATPPSVNEPVMARPAEPRAPRPWEKNDHPAAPPGNPPRPAAGNDAHEDDDRAGLTGALKTGAAAVLGGIAAATSAALRPEPSPARPAEAPRPAPAAPPPFSRSTTTAPQAAAPAPTPPPGARPASARPNWRLPDFTGLLAAGADQEMNHDKLLARARTIEDTLASFGAPGRVVEVRTGPVITQFGVEPDYVEVRGKKNRVKVSAIASLDKDLQLSLGAKSIRIEAPVPGKGYVGIEVPNEKPSIVRLRDVMESNEFRRIQSPLAIALGQGVDGTPVAADLGSMPHLLIAGTTGSGKSVAVNTIIASLLLRNPPDRLKFIMVDPKRVELTSYNGIPHLVAPVVVELERVVSVLKWVTREMDERYRKFALAGARNIEDYNNHLPNNEPIMPYIVVIIDELADLMMMAPDETEKVITRIAALARATGIHLVIATQRPSVDVVTGLIKANFPARIAFAVAGGVDSRVILDQPGAERLLGRGDMLFMSGDTPAPARLQGVYVSDVEIGNITRFWRNQMADPNLANAGKPALSDFHLDEQSKASAQPARGSGIGYGNAGRPASSGPARASFLDDEPDDEADENVDSDDVLYEQAVETVRRLNKASVSLLQRRLRIGYTRAARLIDMMEERGIVGPAVEGSKPRDVLPIDKGKP